MPQITVALGRSEFRSNDEGLTWSCSPRSMPEPQVPVVHGPIGPAQLPEAPEQLQRDWLRRYQCAARIEPERALSRSFIDAANDPESQIPQVFRFARRHTNVAKGFTIGHDTLPIDGRRVTEPGNESLETKPSLDVELH